jgi:hypothetical protein
LSILRIVRTSIFGSALAAGLLVSSASVPAWSQSQSINGTIRGHATDASGASLGGASITLTNAEVGYTNTITSQDDGYFTIINLPLGTYKVVVSKSGFSPLAYSDIVLNAGKDVVLDAVLTVGSTTEQIDVSATISNIDPSTLNVQRTLDQREVENLPLTSRNPYNFILFQPGVSGHPNPELGIPRTINTNGLLDRINYQMDGMVNTQSDRIGLRLFPIGTIFVKEVQTVSNSFAPEFGWTSGNVFNVISNNGTNSYHGLFQYIQRWQDATAYPFFANKALPKTNLELEDVSANLGGRVIKDKLFFFGSYEKVTRGSPAPVTITAANIARLGLTANDVAAAPGLLHGTFTLGRVDWNINKKNTMFVRYNYFKNDFPYNTQVGGLNVRSTGVDFLDRAHVIGTQLVTTVNDHLLNELRFSWPFRNNSHFAGPQGGTGPAITVTGAAFLGASANGGDQYTDKVPSGSDNVTFIHGAHTIKAGFSLAKLINRQRIVSFNRYTFTQTTATTTDPITGLPVVTTTDAVSNYLLAKNGTDKYAYTSFDSQTDTTGLGYASQSLGFYAQDQWQLSPRLLMIYGGRYDRFQSPNANPNAPFINSRKFNVPNTNFAPRVGVTYRATGKTVVKASVGMFYQAVPTNLWFNALNQDGSNRTSIYTYTITRNAAGVKTIPTGAPAFPAIPSTTGVVAQQNVTTISPTFKNEYTWNATAQISQELSRSDTLMIGYVMANGRNLQYLHNINLINPIGTLADGRPIFNNTVNATTRMDPRFNQVNQVESGANSSFNALLVNYTRSLTRGIQLNANYTWSHTISDAPEVNTFEFSPAASFIEDTTNRKRDRGNSSVNHPHAFNMTAVIEPTFRFQNRFIKELANHNMVALLANVSSGDQASIFTGSNINGDASTASVARPAFVGRNTVRSPSVYQFDGRYTRTFPKLFDRLSTSFLLEANNIFNHTNVTSIATNQPVFSDGRPNGNPTVTRGSVLEARIVQWGVAARW